MHSARLAAVGQLAAGIAHEVNNPTAYVLTNLEVLAGHLADMQAPKTETVNQCDLQVGHGADHDLVTKNYYNLELFKA